MTREEKILAMQEPSTRAALSQSEKERFEHRLKPIPKEYLAVPDANNLDELVAPRPLKFMEAQIEHDIRYKRGAKIAEMRGEGDASNPREEKKRSAVNAFMDKFTPKAIKDRFMELMKGVVKPTYAEIVAQELKKRNGDA